MFEIKLLMNNRTALDLIFQYNAVAYHIAAGRSLEISVAGGHPVSVYDPQKTPVTKNRVSVKPDILLCNLDQDSSIDCYLIGWELVLTLRELFEKKIETDEDYRELGEKFPEDE